MNAYAARVSRRRQEASQRRVRARRDVSGAGKDRGERPGVSAEATGAETDEDAEAEEGAEADEVEGPIGHSPSCAARSSADWALRWASSSASLAVWVPESTLLTAFIHALRNSLPAAFAGTVTASSCAA